MSFVPIDDRQVVQRSALTDSIGSSANTTLDALFTQIDSVMVNLAGTQTLTNKTLAFLRTNVITDSTTTGAAATLSGTDTADGTVRLTNASLTSISGITAGNPAQYMTIENQTGSSITINNDDSGASIGNRIYTGTNAGLSMPSNATFTFVYDATVTHWMLTGIAASSPAPIVLEATGSPPTGGSPSDGVSGTLIYGTVVADTDSSYNSSTGIWTCPVTGSYSMVAAAQYSGMYASYGDTTISIVVNGAVRRSTYIVNSASSGLVSAVVPVAAMNLNFGDLVRIDTTNNGWTSFALTSTPGTSYFTINKN